MNQQQEEITCNQFENVLGEYICIHNSNTTERPEDHFPDGNKYPSIKLCSKTLRIRANESWTHLSQEDKECMVAHEMGHREYQHYLEGSFVTLQRYLSAAAEVAPEKEVQADRYACRLLGTERYLKTLFSQRERCKADGKAMAVKEFDLRISELKG